MGYALLPGVRQEEDAARMIVLDRDELIELTGRTAHNAQRRVLDALGIISRTRPDGSLVVLRATAEGMLGLGNSAIVKPKRTEPNWEAIP